MSTFSASSSMCDKDFGLIPSEIGRQLLIRGFAMIALSYFRRKYSFEESKEKSFFYMGLFTEKGFHFYHLFVHFLGFLTKRMI